MSRGEQLDVGTADIDDKDLHPGTGDPPSRSTSIEESAVLSALKDGALAAVIQAHSLDPLDQASQRLLRAFRNGLRRARL